MVHLIDVAVDIGRLPADAADTIHQVLRDYRNFVQPKKEIRAAGKYWASTPRNRMKTRGITRTAH